MFKDVNVPDRERKSKEYDQQSLARILGRLRFAINAWMCSSYEGPAIHDLFRPELS